MSKACLLFFFACALTLFFASSCGITSRYERLSFSPGEGRSGELTFRLLEAAVLYAEPKRYLSVNMAIENDTSEKITAQCSDIYIKLEDGSAYYPATREDAVRLERMWLDNTLITNRQISYHTAENLRGEMLRCNLPIPPQSVAVGRLYFEIPMAKEGKRVEALYFQQTKFKFSITSVAKPSKAQSPPI